MYEVRVRCQRCDEDFKAKRSDAKWCKGCLPAVVLENGRRSENKRRRPCPECNARSITRSAQRCRSCANRLRTAWFPRERNPSWKGGRTRHRDGYWYVRIGSGKEAKYVLEHRHVWEQAHGPIPKNWHVHHLNGDKADNRLENLVAMSRSDHHKNHHEPWERRIRELERQLATA